MKGSKPSKKSLFLELLFLVMLLWPISGTGQWSAEAELDSNRMRIGEQPTLTLRIEYQDAEGNKEVRLPEIGKRISDKIEVIEKAEPDTLIPHEEQAPELHRIVQKVRITSFDTGHHVIPPFHFELKGDSVKTEPLFLEVQSVDLGEKPAPKPIKDIRRTPYSWTAWFKDHWPWFAGVGALLLIALLLFLYFRKRGEKEEEAPVVPSTPPDEKALEELKRLKKEKAVQEMEAKAFYTELSTILRHYLEERYQIPALEETTERTLHRSFLLGTSEKDRNRIGQVLRSADLAKFARTEPTVPEREEHLEDCVHFVENTRPPKPEKTESEEA